MDVDIEIWRTSGPAELELSVRQLRRCLIYKMTRMYEDVDLRNPDDAKAHRAAVSRYKKWCYECDLKPVDTPKMAVDVDARTYTLRDATGGTIIEGKVDDLLADLDKI